MPIKPLSLYTHYHQSDDFSLLMKHTKNRTKFIMSIQGGILNTRELPETHSILKQFIPSVLQSMCYNENDYPFYKEVLRTEVGHLFEHILIEYLCLIKVSQGYDDVEFSGLTKWNWSLYPRGTFHITISAGKNDLVFLADAMEKTISLIQMIFQSVPKAHTIQSGMSQQFTESAMNSLPVQQLIS